MKTVIDHLGCHTAQGDPSLEIRVQTLFDGVNLKNELQLSNKKLDDALLQIDSFKLQLAELKNYVSSLEEKLSASSKTQTVESIASSAETVEEKVQVVEKPVTKNSTRKATKTSE